MPFERAKAALAGTRFEDLRWVPETGSTNADVAAILAERGADGARTPVVLVAEHQTAGRGRRDRSWAAPRGASLLMSVGIPVDGIDPSRRPLVNAAVALAAVDAAPDLRVKWPNDLVAPGAGADGADLKVAGILAELHAGRHGAGSWLVVGIGMNLNWGRMPAELAATATSLDLLLGGTVDAEVVALDLLVSLDGRWLDLLDRPDAPTGSVDGSDELLDAYRSRSATLGRRVRVELDPAADAAPVVDGTAVDVDAAGALVIESDSGERRTVTVGDVVHLRPT